MGLILVTQEPRAGLGTGCGQGTASDRGSAAAGVEGRDGVILGRVPQGVVDDEDTACPDQPGGIVGLRGLAAWLTMPSSSMYAPASASPESIKRAKGWTSRAGPAPPLQ